MPETIDVKAGNHIVCKHYHKGINDEQKETQGKNGNGNGKYRKQWFYKNIQQPDHSNK